MEIETKQATNQNHAAQQENTQKLPQVDIIIAIAKKVESECPAHFEQVFQAIMNSIYKA